MPRNNSRDRRAARRLAALQRSPSANIRLLANIGSVLQHIREDEENRLCDQCQLPKWECEARAATDIEGHVFSPMSPPAQLRVQDAERAMFDQIDATGTHFSVSDDSNEE